MSADQNQANTGKMSGSPDSGSNTPLSGVKASGSSADQSGQKSIIREYAEAIIVAILLAFVIRVFVVQAFKIPSGSMIPTLLIGDHILVSKLSYGMQWPTDCQLQWNVPPVNCYAP